VWRDWMGKTRVTKNDIQNCTNSIAVDADTYSHRS
jgi:hypothetical protein